MSRCCPVVELRQYTLKPGKRDMLIELFEREFIESQETCGIVLIGQFRDQGNPDRFVWLRGFADMEARAKALAAFYGGPVWKAHRAAANDTMIDSDNVLLLKPARRGGGFQLPPRPMRGAECELTAAIYYLKEPADDAFLAAFGNGSADFVTEDAANTFPALPVREGESVFVSFPAQAPARDVTHWLKAPPETLHLSPTARSRLR